MVPMVIAFIVTIFFIYMLIRNQLVYLVRLRFIEFFFNEDPDGFVSGGWFHDEIPGYDEMLWKFWVWPLSSFYPAYHNRKR